MAASGLGLSGTAAVGSTVPAMDAAAMGVGMEAMAGGVSPEVAAQMAAVAAGKPASAGYMFLPAMQNPTTAGLVGTPAAASSNAGLFGNVKNFLKEDAVGGFSRGDMLGMANRVSGIGQQQQPEHAAVSNPYAAQQMAAMQTAGPMPNPYAQTAQQQDPRLRGFLHNNRGFFPRAIV
jgi:hypothetical protein